MSDRYAVVQRRELGREAWDDFAESCEEAWLWHRYALPETLATWPGSEDCSFALIDHAARDEVVALLPIRRINRRFLRVVPVHVLESIGGPAIHAPAGGKARREIQRALRATLLSLSRQGNCLETRVFTSPMAPALRGERCPRVNPLLDLGCENALTQTWVVDLRTGKDDVWARMDGRARTAVRKAEKAGVAVRAATSADLDLYYRLHVETYRRTGAQPHPRAYFQAIWEHFLAHGMARVWFAEVDGEVVAAENFAVYKQAAVYWTGASSRRGLAVEANSLLQWSAMQWMIEHGLEWYETGEAFPQVMQGKFKGLNDFKKGFGGETYPYYRARLMNGSWSERLYQVRQLLRNEAYVNG